MVHTGKGSAGITDVAVTFPSRRVIVEYERPAPSNGSAAHFQRMAKGFHEAQVIRLGGGVPAFTIKQNSDTDGHNFGVIIFNVAGSEIRVMGHYDLVTLQRVAESILERTHSVIPRRRAFVVRVGQTRTFRSARGGDTVVCVGRGDSVRRRVPTTSPSGNDYELTFNKKLSLTLGPRNARSPHHTRGVVARCTSA
jgi:hypothetical protein